MKAISSIGIGAKNRVAKITLVVVVMNVLSISLMAIDTDEELPMESWMIAPFELAMEESDVGVEQWMTTPFESAYVETESAYVETETPFEAWMAVPFENGTAGELVVVESWMVTPFDTGVDDSSGFGVEFDCETRP
jgi:hypothetical protein